MKALAIRQPWVWAIVNAGKPVENRDWQGDGRNMRDARALQNSNIALLASKGVRRQEYLDYIEIAHTILVPSAVAQTPEREELENGGIVAIARLVGIIDGRVARYDTRPELDAARQSPWFCGPYGLVLANVRKAQFVPYRGFLGFFDVPDNLVKEITP